MHRSRKNIAVIVLLIVIALISLRNVNTIFKKVSAENYLEEVLQNNIDKMSTSDNINSYSDEFVLDYITTSHDYDETISILDQITQLSDSICDGIDNDYEKLEKIHDYVCENVAYDYIAKENSANLDTVSLKNILENRRTICAGYANIFSALCNAQGLYCINLRGVVRSAEYPDISDENAATNHEWNAVWLDSESRWVYIDCTWDSNYIYDDNGFMYTNNNRKYVRTYFDMSMEDMTNNHKIRIINHWDFYSAIDYLNSTTQLQTDSQININNDNDIDTNSTSNSYDSSNDITTINTDTSTSDSTAYIIVMLAILLCVIVLTNML